MKKKIALISVQPHWKPIENESLLRFPEEVRALGHEAEIMFFDKFFVSLSLGKTSFFYDGKPLPLDDYALFILIMSGKKAGGFLAELLESAGAKTKNCLQAINIAKNKFHTSLILGQAGIPVLPAAVNFSEFNLGRLLEFFPDRKYVYKNIKGSGGRGVGFLESPIALISFYEFLASLQVGASEIMIEKFAVEASGRDIRIIATKEKAIAAMERRSNGVDFRANISGGGQGRPYAASAEMEALAVRAINALGLDYGGVDILETKDGPVVLEVNSNPGLKIEKCIGRNVAKEIVAHLLVGLTD